MAKWIAIALICAATIGLCLNLPLLDFATTKAAVEQTSQAADIVTNDFTTIQMGLDIFRRLFFYDPETTATRMFKRRATGIEIQTTIEQIDPITGNIVYEYDNATYSFTTETARNRTYDLLSKTLYPRSITNPDNWFESMAQDIGVILSLLAYFFSVLIFAVYLVLDIAGVGWNLVLAILSILRFV